MRVTKVSAFVHAIIMALVGFVGAEWGLVASAFAIAAALIALIRSPRLVRVDQAEHVQHVRVAESEFRHGVPEGGSSLPVLYRLVSPR